MRYNPFSFLVEKFLAEELSRADAVETAAREDAIMKAAEVPCCTVEQRNAIYAATMRAGAKRAADMRAGAVAIAKMRAGEMMTDVEIAKAADSGTHRERPRGPRPAQMSRVLAAMRADLELGSICKTPPKRK